MFHFNLHYTKHLLILLRRAHSLLGLFLQLLSLTLHLPKSESPAGFALKGLEKWPKNMWLVGCQTNPSYLGYRFNMVKQH
jgi:hypothetical protein